MLLVPLVVMFGLGALLIERSGRVSVLEEMVFVLFGFFLGATGLAPLIDRVVVSLLGMSGR
ncbi:MAG: hypothetical protein ACRDRL_02825 [Sciscionella sp.]